MLRAYADEHVVQALVQALRARGMDVVTVQERGRRSVDDEELLAEALAERRVMLTNDADFLAIAARYARKGDAFAPIVFWPQQMRGIGYLVRIIIREANAHEYDEILSRVFFV